MLFKSYQLGERGTEIAIFDCAYFAEKYFYVKSYFVLKKLMSVSAEQKFDPAFLGRVLVPPSDAALDEN